MSHSIKQVMAAIISIVVITIAVLALVSHQIISVDIALLVGGSIALSTILLEAIIPKLLDYSISPKVALQISEITLEKKTFNDIEGYLIKTSVTNKGKRVAINIDATVKVENKEKASPNFLTVNVTKRNDTIISATSSEENFESDKFAWIKPQERTTEGSWKQLRQRDEIILQFPYVRHIWVASLEDPDFTYYETVLSLEKNTIYKVTVEVKGEDAERNTVSAKASKNVVLT